MSDHAPIIRRSDVQQRMDCESHQVATAIADAFTTVEELVWACKSDKVLTEVDGVGPATAECIEDWWVNRFEREEEVSSASFKRESSTRGTITFHSDWSDYLEVDDG